MAGRKPAKVNSSVGRPEPTSPATTAHGPGTGTTGRPAPAAAATRALPGSLMPYNTAMWGHITGRRKTSYKHPHSEERGDGAGRGDKPACRRR